MAHSKQEQDYAKTIELARFKDERHWPAPYVHVKTWPWIEPRQLGTLSKGTFRVVITPGVVEQFKNYDELVQRWMGD